ncbi:MAG: phytoene synthase [Cypionkella sp.]|uniref:squalene/phytoene synthase family protein n=1 Tax=Cypionkella sp. TaxID=2811411 RepID=UPI002628D16C|nr:squalene/phytoene synthase family protein [Cypionkella sp.]MDB5660303.1 phytoene synthase [Cypionkella sp.]
MSLAACADLVERGDPDRFTAVMAAPVEMRGRLWPLYAFNLEIARAPWVTKQPMIAEMRLQWWRDVVTEPAPRAHEVAGPLHELIGAAGLDVAVLDRMAAARVWDVYSEPFEDQAAFDVYLDETSGGLMWLAARACGAQDRAEQAVRDYGWAAGLASYLRAVPALEERGRRPLVDGRPGAVRDLAARGLQKISAARVGRRWVGKASPALLAGWQAEALLRQVVADPMIVAEGRMGLSEFARRGRLTWQALSGRW